MKALIAIGVVCFALVAGIAVWAIGVSNSEVRLRNLATAEQQVSKQVFDSMWKIIAEQAEVNDSTGDKQIEFQKALVEGRAGGTVAKFVQESSVKLDIRLAATLMRSIESQRIRFETSQKKLTDIKREHDNLIGTFPGSLIAEFRNTNSRLDAELVIGIEL